MTLLLESPPSPPNKKPPVAIGTGGNYRPCPICDFPMAVDATECPSCRAPVKS